MTAARRFFLPLIFLLLFTSHALSQPKTFLRTDTKFRAPFLQIVEPHVSSTVRVQCDEKDVCLGIIVGADGWILTKAHDLKGKIICKLADGRALEARIVGIHEPNDLAMLRASG